MAEQKKRHSLSELTAKFGSLLGQERKEKRGRPRRLSELPGLIHHVPGPTSERKSSKSYDDAYKEALSLIGTGQKDLEESVKLRKQSCIELTATKPRKRTNTVPNVSMQPDEGQKNTDS